MTDASTAEREQHGRLHSAADRARETASHARETAADAARRTAETVEASPLGIVAGGLALGAIAGALLPRSEKEKELLAPLGRQLNERGRAAFRAAQDAGKAQLNELGLTRGAAKDQARSVLDGLGKALSSAGSAAAKSAAAKPAEPQQG